MNNLPEKLKSTLYICCLERSTKIKIEIIFGKENFSIYFIEPLKPEYIKEIREIFLPFISDDNSQIKINYIYIKNIYEDSSRLLKFTLHNPLSLSIFTIIFNRLKYKKSIIFWEKDLPPLLLPSISLNINQKIMAIAERKINDWRLDGYDLIVSLKPCEMCSIIIKESRIDNIYYFVESNDNNNVLNNMIKIDDYNEYTEQFQTMIKAYFKSKR
jgi:hypothetical protein